MERVLHRGADILTGHTLTTVITLGALGTSLHLWDTIELWRYETIAAVILIRLVIRLSTRTETIFSRRFAGHRLQGLLVDEFQFGVAFLAICFVMKWALSLEQVLLFLSLNLTLQLSVTYLSRRLSQVARTVARPDRPTGKLTVIAGTGPMARQVADAILDTPELGISLIGFLDYHRKGLWRYRDIPLVGHPDMLQRIALARQVDAVYIALEPHEIGRSVTLFTAAEKMGVTIYKHADFYPSQIAKARVARLNGFSAIEYRPVRYSYATFLVKQALDRIGAAVGLILLSPLMVAAALLIKLESRGPVLFKQTRLGLNGRRFQLYKFRTMIRDAERHRKSLQSQNEMSGPVFKIRNDPRVTRFGRVLRKYSIDELPQLVNVLTGDMSLVGPRPPLPSEVERFEPWQRRKLSVPPGLTCLWQINGRNAIDFEEWMRLDLNYIDNWSLFLDAKILAKTLPAVLKGSGS